MNRQTGLSAVAILLTVLWAGTAWPGALDRGPMGQRYNQTTDEMIRVPGTLGMWKEDAMAVLQQAGVVPNVKYEKKQKKDLAGKEGTVIDQEPGAGGITMLGSTVTITVYWPPSQGNPPEPGPVQDTNHDAGPWGQTPGAASPPAGQTPPPQWGVPSQQAPGPSPAVGGGWTPPPAAPATRGQAAPAAQQPASPPPVAAEPVQPTATRVDQGTGSSPTVTATPVEPAATQAAQTQPERTPPVSVTATPVQPTATRADRGTESKPRVTMTPVEPTATRSRQQGSSAPSVTATPAEPTVTQARQQESSTPSVTMTPVQQTVTPSSMGPGGTQAVDSAPTDSPSSGRVRIVITRVEAVTETGDKRGDGDGDEIIVAARGLWYLKHNKQVLKEIIIKSPTYRRILKGMSFSPNVTVFDQVLGSSQELIFFPTLWEEDSEYGVLDEFLNRGRITSQYPDWDSDDVQFVDPLAQQSGVNPRSDNYSVSTAARTRDRICSEPASTTRLIGVTNHRWFLRNKYTLPVGYREYNRTPPRGTHVNHPNREEDLILIGPKFSVNWAFAETVGRTDCGFGPGVLRLQLKSLGPHDENLGEYNMYLRFIVSPAPGTGR